jgi:hypothetical protein
LEIAMAMGSSTDKSTPNTGAWQGLLIVLGIILLAAAGFLQWVISSYHTTSTVSKVGDVTTTVTGPSGPPAALVTTCLGVGAILVLAGCFFGRISKVVITGIGELDLSTQADIAKAATEAVGNDPTKVGEVLKRATRNLINAQMQSLAVTGSRSISPKGPQTPVDTAVALAVDELGYA